MMSLAAGPSTRTASLAVNGGATEPLGNELEVVLYGHFLRRRSKHRPADRSKYWAQNLEILNKINVLTVSARAGQHGKGRLHASHLSQGVSSA